VELDERTCWYNLSATDGLGPVGAQKIAHVLDEKQASVLMLVGLDASGLAGEFGLSERLAYAVEQQLLAPISLPDVPEGVELVVPGDEHFPNRRFLTAVPPIPPVLWCGGERSLLAFAGSSLGIAGSRETSEDVLELVYHLASEASRSGWLVVSGLAQGVDSEGHRGGINGRTGTVGVLASGIVNSSRSWQPDDLDQLCVVSQFAPSDPWTGPRAMQRNGVIAALSDRVVVAAAGMSGGSYEMAQLCLKRKKPVYVFDLPPDVAEGNQRLIRDGAIPLDPTGPSDCLTPLQEPAVRKLAPLTLFETDSSGSHTPSIGDR